MTLIFFKIIRIFSIAIQFVLNANIKMVYFGLIYISEFAVLTYIGIFKIGITNINYKLRYSNSMNLRHYFLIENSKK